VLANFAQGVPVLVIESPPDAEVNRVSQITSSVRSARGTHFRDGQRRDSFIYGIIRDDIGRSSAKR